MFSFVIRLFNPHAIAPSSCPNSINPSNTNRSRTVRPTSSLGLRHQAPFQNDADASVLFAAQAWIPLLSWIGLVTASVAVAILLSRPAAAPAAENSAPTSLPLKSAAPNSPYSTAAPKANAAGERVSLPSLPRAVTSFGAAAIDGSVFIYGGHVGVAHDYHRDTQINTFARLDLKSPRQWQMLPTGSNLQGLAMVADRGIIYRIGGMQARNGKEERENLHSIAEFAAFDPSTNQWRELPPTPAAISSHEAAVHAGKIYVLGGWTLTGESRHARWADHGWVFDPTKPAAGWQALAAQGFQRRAIAAAATSKHIYVMGGLTDRGASNRVDIFEPATGKWKQGPDLPLIDRMKGFGGVAIAIGDDVIFSGYSGRIWRLHDGDEKWTDTGYHLKLPRFFHRIVEIGGGKLMFLGGAGKAGNTAEVETVELQTLLARPTGQLPAAPPPGADPAAGSSRWPGFLGLNHSQTQAKNLPLHWSDERGVAWKLDLPGVGQSSPVIHDGRVYATSVDHAASQLVITAADLKSGAILWQRKIASSTLRPISDYISKAAPTPLVDEQGVYAFFETGDLLAFTHDGAPRWSRSLTADYGPIQGNHGLGSSPAMTADSIILLVDHDGPSYLAALDKTNGKTRWKADRPPRVSWSSPQVDGSQILISSSGVMQAFDIVEGKLLWQLDGLAGNTVASPAATGKWIINPSSEVGGNLALNRQQLTGGAKPQPAWSTPKATASFASPVACGSMVYFINKAGVLFGVGLEDGAMRWAVRLPSPAWATPIVAGRRIYIFGTDGASVVMEGDAAEPRKLAENRLTLPEKSRVYGAAAVDGCLVLRLDQQLICIR